MSFRYDRVEMQRLYDEHRSAEKVAAIVGCNRSTVLRAVEHKQRPGGDKMVYLPAEQIQDLYDRGLNDQEIADALGVTRRQVQNWRCRPHRRLPQNGVDPATVGRPKRFDRKVAYELVVKRGLTPKQIAAEMGCSIEQVYRFRREFGVAKPDHTKTLPPMEERLKQAAKMVEEGASFAEICRTVHIHRETLNKHFPGKQWTHRQAVEHALNVRYGEQRINKAWSATGTQALTRPPFTK
jgi:DNA-binding CsgD family transcriptional regulator/DNA-binding transcriptional regulator YiaG